MHLVFHLHLCPWCNLSGSSQWIHHLCCTAQRRQGSHRIKYNYHMIILNVFTLKYHQLLPFDYYFCTLHSKSRIPYGQSQRRVFSHCHFFWSCVLTCYLCSYTCIKKISESCIHIHVKIEAPKHVMVLYVLCVFYRVKEGKESRPYQRPLCLFLINVLY